MEPFDAQGLSSEPALAPSGAGDYGLNYYSASLGQLAAGQQMTLHLKYSKPTATLSANAVGASAPAATPNESKPSQPLELTPILLAAAAGIGLLLIGGGAYSLMRSKKEERRAAQSGRPARRRRERRAPHAATPTSAAPAATPTRFCTQCGRQLLTDDRFCRNCGAKVRDG
ncbi:MAG: zinc ribbon domain-containing protein [Chloroflexi bacterium]|nr:zinc ribbon domain-containing protein [Chloroflexota bacterium]